MVGAQTKAQPYWMPTAPEEPEQFTVFDKLPPPSPASTEETKVFSAVLVENENLAVSHPDADTVLEIIDSEKKLSILKAWLQYEKSKIINKAKKERSVLAAWYNNKKAALEAKYRKHEEQKDQKKKALSYEKLENKRALMQKQSEEKKALIQAKYCKNMVKIQSKAASYRTRETTPKKFFGCFWV